MLTAIRARLPSQDSSTILGCAVLAGIAAGLGLGLTLWALAHAPAWISGPIGGVVSGAWMAVWPQHAAPSRPVTAADVVPPASEPAVPSAASAERLTKLLSLYLGDTIMPIPTLASLRVATLSLSKVGAAETEAIAVLRETLPVLSGFATMAETGMGASAAVTTGTAAALAIAQQAVDALSATSPVTDVDTAMIAVGALAAKLLPALPVGARTIASAIMAAVEGAYEVWASAKAAVPAAPVAPSATGTVAAPVAG